MLARIVHAPPHWREANLEEGPPFNDGGPSFVRPSITPVGKLKPARDARPRREEAILTHGDFPQQSGGVIVFNFR